MVSRAEDLRLRALLAERLGEDATDKLMERLPVTPVENFATKDDIAAVRGELLHEFGALRGEFGALRGEFGTLRGEFGRVEARLAAQMRQLTYFVIGALGTGIGVTGALVGALS